MPAVDSILLQCRPGFEHDCAQEFVDWADARGLSGECETLGDGGLVRWSADSDALADAAGALDLAELIFSRQWFLVMQHVQLDASDRVQGLLAAWQGATGARVLLEHADSEAGRELAGLCRSLTAPLVQALKKNDQLSDLADQQLHVLFVSGTEAYVGVTPLGRASALEGGIRRLRMPREAPSRSTLKLEEALLQFVPKDQWPTRLRPGVRAVDLGASPGGWTWQMVQHGVRVIAIDNGKMDEALMATGLVEHLRVDGFTYRPDKRVDWLLCDMVEKPTRVAKLLAQWLERGWCREAIINLKLPMKRRYGILAECLQVIAEPMQRSGREFQLQAKQLYHDREEITVHVRVLGTAAKDDAPKKKRVIGNGKTAKARELQREQFEREAQLAKKSGRKHDPRDDAAQRSERPAPRDEVVASWAAIAGTGAERKRPEKSRAEKPRSVKSGAGKKAKS